MPKVRVTSKGKPSTTAQDLKTRALLRQIGFLYKSLRARDQRIQELQRGKDSGSLVVEWDTNRSDLGDLTLVELRNLASTFGGGTKDGIEISEPNA